MNIEQGILFANKLLLVCWGSDNLPPIADIRLSDATGEAVVVPAPLALSLRKRTAGKSSAKNAVETSGFVIPVPLGEILTLDFERGGCSVALRLEDGAEIMNPALRVRPIDLRRELGSAERALLEFAVRSGIYDAAVGQLFNSSTTWMPDLSGLAYHIDHQLQSRTG